MESFKLLATKRWEKVFLYAYKNNKKLECINLLDYPCTSLIAFVDDIDLGRGIIAIQELFVEIVTHSLSVFFLMS